MPVRISRSISAAIAVLVGLQFLPFQKAAAVEKTSTFSNSSILSGLPKGSVVYKNDVVIDVSKLPNGILNIPKSLGNTATILLVSSNPKITTAIINASQIYNLKGGEISTVLPSGGVPGLTGLDSTLNLTLDSKSILNVGVIDSSGTLTLNAASVSNVRLTGLGGMSGSMLAAGNISLMTRQFTNLGGSVASAGGNISIGNAAGSSNTQIYNWGGSMQASSISISSSSSLSIIGGTLLAQNITATAGHDMSLLDADLDALTDGNGNGGNITLSAGAARRGSISMNCSTLNADGSGSGNGGNVTVSASNLCFNYARASANGGAQSGNGGNISVVASGDGSDFNVNAGRRGIALSATGGSPGSNGGDAGSIEAAAGGDLTVNGSGINLGTLGTVGNGGNLTLAAGYRGQTPGTFNGTPVPDIQLGEWGSLTLSGGRISADAVGNSIGGVVTLAAPRIVAGTQSNVLVSARGGADAGFILVNGNSLHIANHNVTFSDDAANYDGSSFAGTTDITVKNISVDCGSLTFSGIGSQAGGFGGLVELNINNYWGHGTPLVVNVYGIDGSGGGDFYINNNAASPNVYISSVIVNGTNTEPGAPGTDGTVINANVAGNLTFGHLVADVSANGDGGTGAPVTLTAGISGTGVLTIRHGSITSNGTGTGDGGAITITAPQVNVNPGVTLTANGGADGSNGTITIDSTNPNAPVAYEQKLNASSNNVDECIVDSGDDVAE